jgi:hypothetical protein
METRNERREPCGPAAAGDDVTTYCYVCPAGHRAEYRDLDTDFNYLCCVSACHKRMRRDWRAENATFTRVPGGART